MRKFGGHEKMWKFPLYEAHDNNRSSYYNWTRYKPLGWVNKRVDIGLYDLRGGNCLSFECVELGQLVATRQRPRNLTFTKLYVQKILLVKLDG